MSSSSQAPSKKPINKKTATPVRGPFGQRYDPESGSVYREHYPRIVRPVDPGSPPSVNPPVPNTIPKSFATQKNLQNTSDTNYQQEWHSAVRQQIINQLLHLNPSGLPSQMKLQGLSSVQLARWAIPTLTAADPTGLIAGTASTDPTTMDDLVTALQTTASTTYSKNQILAHLTAHKEKLNDSFEALAMNYVAEFPPLPSSPPRDHGPMNAVEAVHLSSKRAYQPTLLELVGSSQSKRQTSVSVSAATVATQVGLSSSIPAKQRNPGQRQIQPAKHFGEYYGSDKIIQLATNILPGTLTMSSQNPKTSKASSPQELQVSSALSSPSNHFDKYVAERAAAQVVTASMVTSSLVLTNVAPQALPSVVPPGSSTAVLRIDDQLLRSNRIHAGLSPESGDDDSIESSSPSDTPLDNVTAPDNIVMVDEPSPVALGVYSDLFEACFSVKMSASNKLYLPPGTKSDSGLLYGPVLVPSPTAPPAVIPLVAHAADAVVLDKFYQSLPDSDIFILLYTNWNALHFINSLAQLRLWLESRQLHDHLLLVHLFAAYWNCIPTVSLSFGDIKALFWNCAQVDVTFAIDLFNVKAPAAALSTITINFFLVRTIQQWVLFLTQQCISIVDCLPIIEHMGPIFACLEPHVHPAFDYCIGALSTMVHFCSRAAMSKSVRTRFVDWVWLSARSSSD
jgi:hypothetical protein